MSATTATDVIEGRAAYYLHCGDAMVWLPTLPDACVDAVVADPPYGIDISKVGSGTGGKGTYHRFTRSGSATIAGDKAPDPRWLTEAFRLLRPNGVLYSFSRWDVDRDWHTAIEAVGFRLKNRIVWAKAHHGSGDLAGAFGCSHETIWRASKARQSFEGIELETCGVTHGLSVFDMAKSIRLKNPLTSFAAL